ncbi:1475_t:CDS:1, partial [Racocetra persica]
EVYKLSLLRKLDINHQFTYDLISAYKIYIQRRAALIYRHVEFYKQIGYTLLNDDETFNIYMNLYSDNMMQIQEEN